MKLPRSAYEESSPVKMARYFLGKRLVVDSTEGRVAGIIWETEAYGGLKDKACHGYGGRRTERTRVMFESGGISYVYFTYGMHYLLNFVTGERDHPKAVLIRAVWVTEGIELARQRRRWVSGKPHAWLADGPGKVCQAFGISREHNALPLDSHRLWVEETGLTPRRSEISTSPRIGIAYAGEYVHKPWRFVWKAEKLQAALGLG